MTKGRRAQPFITPMHRGQLPACSCRHQQVDGLHRLNVMKEASLGATLRRVTEGASSKEARLHVARWIGSQSQAAGLLSAR